MDSSNKMLKLLEGDKGQKIRINPAENNLLLVCGTLHELNKHIDTKQNKLSPEENQKIQVLSAVIYLLNDKIGIDEFKSTLSNNPEYDAGFFFK